MARSTESAKLTIPADYLEDARSALIKEIELDGEALRASQADFRADGHNDPTDRDSSALMLRRDLELLGQLPADGDAVVTAQHNRMAMPLVEMLEAMARVLSERLVDVVQYGPIPMGDVLDVATQLRWAAEEAIRLDPSMDRRLKAIDWRRSAGKAA